jgi:hypothetical protein
VGFTKWPTVKQFTSWLGLCPNWHKTGGKVKASQTRRGRNRAAGELRLAAWSLLRSKSYLGGYLRRQRSRLGAPMAITATAHKQARIVYHLVRYGLAYVQQTEAAYAEQVALLPDVQLIELRQDVVAAHDYPVLTAQRKPARLLASGPSHCRRVRGCYGHRGRSPWKYPTTRQPSIAAT